MDGFQSQFANSAQDAEAFHSLMQTAFGDKYDKQAAEGIRQQTLAGDFSWMPDVELVDGSTLASSLNHQQWNSPVLVDTGVMLQLQRFGYLF